MECCICAEVKPRVVATLCSQPLNPQGHQPLCCEECMVEVCARGGASRSGKVDCPLCRTPVSHCFVYDAHAYASVPRDDPEFSRVLQWVRHWYVRPPQVQLGCDEDIEEADALVHLGAVDTFQRAYIWSRVQHEAQRCHVRLCHFVLADFCTFPQLIYQPTFSCLSCHMPVGMHERAIPAHAMRP